MLLIYMPMIIDYVSLYFFQKKLIVNSFEKAGFDNYEKHIINIEVIKNFLKGKEIYP